VLTVVCFEWGNYLDRGVEYVAKLRAMVRRHLEAPHQFVVFTESMARHALQEGMVVAPLLPGFKGWWNKLQLFRPGLFKGRVLYLDLDTVITGSLDELVLHKGGVNLLDWGWKEEVTAGGMLLWDAGEHAGVWERREGAQQQFQNDQQYINSLGLWPRLPAPLLRSYRYHCKGGPPPGCSVVAFHGKPKPHEFKEGTWVHQMWR
jgi:hypothetical protein